MRLILLSILAALPLAAADKIATVTETPGFVALWDFVKREPEGQKRFTAHVPPDATNDFPLDAGNYILSHWGKGPEATYADFPMLGRGPFGNAVRISAEKDPNFRPFLFVPRERLHDSPIDIKGKDKSVSLVVWAVRESGNHAFAGIWHEGTDLKENTTKSIQKVERGQRQYALFAGLNKTGAACGHISENGASSFLNKYALHKSNSLPISPAIPANASPEKIDASWQLFAMTYDHTTRELTSSIDGVSGRRWQESPKKGGLLASAYNAYMQGHYHRLPGTRPNEDSNFPADQYYNPPEDKVVFTKVLTETENKRVEFREHPYTKIEVTLEKQADGSFAETSRDLVGLSLNPWWFSHDHLYTPKDDGSGGPFTIGRVIHSARTIGFTGWIGGVAVFDRALSTAELKKLTALRTN